MKKKLISINIAFPYELTSFNKLPMSIDKLIENLEETKRFARKASGGKCKYIEVMLDSDYDSVNGFEFTCFRIETDAELLRRRMINAKKYKSAKEARKRQKEKAKQFKWNLYLKLKKEFKQKPKS